MARAIGPDEACRLVYVTSGTNRGKAAGQGLLAPLYLDEALTTLADVLTLSDAAIAASTVTVDSYSMIPLVKYPDDVDTIWTSINGGPATPLYARTDDRLDALGARVATLETGGASDTLALHKAGAETVTGVKTFTVEPVVPTPTAGTSPATKAYADAGDAAAVAAAAVDATSKVAAEATSRASGDTAATATAAADATTKADAAQSAAIAAAATDATTRVATETTARTAADALLTPLTRTVSTAVPVTGGGDLSANRTIAISNATTGTTGVVQLAGDLAGTATAPTVPGLAGKVAKGDLVLNVKDYGALGNNTGNDATAIQAAIDALPTSGTYTGGCVFLPIGTYRLTTPIVLKSGVHLLGASRTGSRISATSGGLFTWTAALTNVLIEGLYLSGVSGHLFTPSGGSADWGIITTTVQFCNIAQLDTTKSIMHHVSAADYDNVTFADCDLTRAAGATVPGFNIVNSGGAANQNRWKDCWARSSNSSTAPFFYIESTSASNYAYDNVFKNITGEQNPGGIIDARSTYNLVVNNVVDYDTIATYSADIIRVGKSATGGLRSIFPTITASGRRDNTTLPSGIYDINLVPTEVFRALLLSPNHSSTTLKLNFGTADQVTIVNAPAAAWSGQPTNVRSYFSSQAQFASGLYVGSTQETAGTGSPEGAVSGSVGDRFIRTDGGAGTSFYVKESGAATTTGWTPYGSDATAVHLAGTETVTGAKTFTANLAVSSSLANILSTNRAVPTTAAWNNQNAATLANSSTFQINGTNTLRIRSSTGTANPIAAGIGTVVNTLDQMPVNASTQYTAVLSFLAETTSRTCSLFVRTYDSGGSQVRSLNVSVTDNTTTPTQAAITFTTSSSEVNVGLFCQIFGTPPTSENHYVGQAQIIQGTSTTWLAPGTTPSATLSPTGFTTANGALVLASSGSSGVTVNAASGTGTSGLIVGDGAGNNVLSAAGTGVYVQGLIRKRTAVADVDYTVLTSDGTVAYTSLTAARVQTLPAQGATLPIGREFTIKDESGSCDGTKTLTITPPSGTIDGAATLVLNSAYVKATVYTNGSNWFSR